MKLRIQSIHGYVYGLHQPSVILRTPSAESSEKLIESKLIALSDLLPLKPSQDIFNRPECGLPFKNSLTLFVQIIDYLNTFCGDQRFSKIQILHEDADMVYVIPTLSTSLTRTTIKSLLELLKLYQDNLSEDNVFAFFERCKELCTQYLPGGTNSGNFIAAAGYRKIPFKIFSRNLLIFGYGSGSTILKSSITDKESRIGVGLARNKADTHDFLKICGYPVADQARVVTIDDAISFANKYGYPVVIKPENQEQGRGIRANILDEAELRSCFKDVSESYKGLLIEKHVIGDHYRIDFMGDQLIKAVRRRPAAIVGDGVTTIESLIHQLNAHPDRRDPNSSMKPVIFDDDLERTLSKYGYALTDVPLAGERVLLRSISNLSRGGEQVHVEDTIHGENYKLCRSIARAMRLDVVGIDLLSPDLSMPWYENETVICEVNAQPQLGVSGTEVYWEFLQRYLKPPAIVKLIVSNTLHHCETPLFDTSCEVIEIWITPEEIFRSGCPTQYFSELEIREDVSQSDRKKLERLLRSVEPYFNRS